MPLRQASSDSCAQNMLTMVTHDLKSPLNAIVSIAELCLQQLQDGDAPIDRQELIQDLSIVQTAGRNMLALIGHALTAARIEAGKEPIEPICVQDLAGIITSIGETFRFEAACNRIELEIETAANLPPVCWDICKIQFHVINNLISNALKFVPAGGRVRLTAREEGPEVVIRVMDNGPGIPPAERDKIFDRFARLEVQTDRAYQGTGLGLYSASLFVRQHGGSLTIEDGLDGRGVGFRVAIPVRPPLLLAG